MLLFTLHINTRKLFTDSSFLSSSPLPTLWHNSTIKMQCHFSFLFFCPCIFLLKLQLSITTMFVRCLLCDTHLLMVFTIPHRFDPIKNFRATANIVLHSHPMRPLFIFFEHFSEESTFSIDCFTHPACCSRPHHLFIYFSSS